MNNNSPVFKDNLLSAIQNALPHARVFWEKEPHPFFNERPCFLTAVSLINPNKKWTMPFLHGIGQAPYDGIVKTFVDQASAALFD